MVQTEIPQEDLMKNVREAIQDLRPEETPAAQNTPNQEEKQKPKARRSRKGRSSTHRPKTSFYRTGNK
jgi:hypothetical protein